MYCRCTFAISAVSVSPLPLSFASLSLCVSAQCGPFKKMHRVSYHIGCSAWVSRSKSTRCTGPGPDFSSPSRALHLLLDQLSLLHWLHSSVALRILLHIMTLSQCLCTPIIYVCSSHSASVQNIQILESSFQNKSASGFCNVEFLAKWTFPTVHQPHVSSGGIKLTFLMLFLHWNVGVKWGYFSDMIGNFWRAQNWHSRCFTRNVSTVQNWNCDINKMLVQR